MDSNFIEEKKEKILEVIKSEGYRPMKAKDLAVLMNVPREEKKDFSAVIETLLSEGKIIEDKRNLLKLPGENVFSGVFSGTTKGFGFVRIDERDEEVFIPASSVADAHDKDKVLIEIVKNPSFVGVKKEGVILRVLERNDVRIVGTFLKNNGYGFVHPDNQKFGTDIFIPKGYTEHAVSGNKVICEITFFGSASRKPEGHITNIIGHIDDPGSDIISVIRAFGIPLEFPDGVINELKGIPDHVLPEETVGREDLRSLMTVTIDGEDSKDLDDAVSLTKEGDFYNLGVHIADVTHYVKENSPLDKEALKRGTSNYLIDKVIPMLPHELSNGICSLNAGEDRLALSCLMKIDSKGNVVEHKIVESVILVDKRMSYPSVKMIIEDRDPEETEKYKEFVDMFFLMDELAGILRKKRHKRGSIDFDIPECKIKVDEKGEPIEIGPYERNKATMLIEDFMLIANETVAEDHFWQEIPFVYRTHEAPDPEKIQKLATFIYNFGLTIKNINEEIHPKEIQTLLSKIEGTDEESLIERLTLRSLKQAKYTVNCDGHFGLAARYYCHFTSPIRRYPDLQIHRIIKMNLNGRLTPSKIKRFEAILPDVAYLSSRYERRADEAEREVEKLKKIEYMSKYIGEEFLGVISGVTSTGLYVELKNTVEGLIRIENIDGDYYYFDEEHYMLVGEHTKKTYKLGQKLIVRVERTDKLLRTIDFSIVGSPEEENLSCEEENRK
ncbi:MAG: ribonuclease R [Lachnospiraceae bacterium]|nr:ribonuclease R [Lachnospiraceae bacterium]